MIHSKVIDPEVLDLWQSDIILTLCELEMYFLPSFFDVMHGKRRILGVENVIDEDEYDQFDELPPFTNDVPSLDDDTMEITPVDSHVYGLLDALVLLSLGVHFESCNTMSRRGKRGKAKGKKIYPPESFYIDFNEDGLAIGPTRGRFASWCWTTDHPGRTRAKSSVVGKKKGLGNMRCGSFDEFNEIELLTTKVRSERRQQWRVGDNGLNNGGNIVGRTTMAMVQKDGYRIDERRRHMVQDDIETRQRICLLRERAESDTPEGIQ
ncbi:alpha/beta hydrolase fold-1 [Tanacetum coccineum]